MAQGYEIRRIDNRSIEKRSPLGYGDRWYRKRQQDVTRFLKTYTPEPAEDFWVHKLGKELGIPTIVSSCTGQAWLTGKRL